MFLVSANAVLLVVGGWVYRSRMIGLFCHHFLLIFNITSLVITHKYRNSQWGQLAALSTMPSKTISDFEYDENWTYQDDAHFIDKMWAFQMVTFFLCLCTSNIGCFKIWNRTDIRDSQVRSTFRASNVPDQKQTLMSAD